MQVLISAIPSPALLGSGKEREHQDAAQGSCLFCDATAGPAGKGVRRKSCIMKLHTAPKSPETSLAGPSVSPAMSLLVHGGFVLLVPPCALFCASLCPFLDPLCPCCCRCGVLLQPLPDLRFLCAVLLMDSLDFRLPPSDPWGELTQHHPHLAITQQNSSLALTTFLSCSIFQAGN